MATISSVIIDNDDAIKILQKYFKCMKKMQRRMQLTEFVENCVEINFGLLGPFKESESIKAIYSIFQKMIVIASKRSSIQLSDLKSRKLVSLKEFTTIINERDIKTVSCFKEFKPTSKSDYDHRFSQMLLGDAPNFTWENIKSQVMLEYKDTALNSDTASTTDRYNASKKYFALIAHCVEQYDDILASITKK